MSDIASEISRRVVKKMVEDEKSTDEILSMLKSINNSANDTDLLKFIVDVMREEPISENKAKNSMFPPGTTKGKRNSENKRESFDWGTQSSSSSCSGGDYITRSRSRGC